MKILDINVKNVKIPVVFESSKAMPVVSLKLVFKAAGSSQNGKLAGLARLSANLLNEGDMKLGSAKFAKELEVRAISLNASCDFETFCIDLNCLKEHFAFACGKLKELLLAPNLTDEILNRCKTVTLGEIAANENDFDYVARQGLFELLYPKSVLALPSIGTKKSIKAITLEDVSKFLNEHLDLSNLLCVLGGDIDEKQTKEVAKVLEILKPGKVRKLERFSPSNKCETSEIIRQSEQAYIYFGAPFNVKPEEKYKAAVATFILGEGGFGSRLMEEIRVKRGLAYSAYARNLLNLSYSQLYGYMQTKNEKKDEAIAVIKDEILKFSKKGVSKAELEQAKKFLLSSLPLRLETLFKRLDIAQGEFYEHGELGAFLKDLDKISALSLNELNSFIKAHAEINELSFCVLKNEI